MNTMKKVLLFTLAGLIASNDNLSAMKRGHDDTQDDNGAKRARTGDVVDVVAHGAAAPAAPVAATAAPAAPAGTEVDPKDPVTVDDESKALVAPVEEVLPHGCIDCATEEINFDIFYESGTRRTYTLSGLLYPLTDVYSRMILAKHRRGGIIKYFSLWELYHGVLQKKDDKMLEFFVHKCTKEQLKELMFGGWGNHIKFFQLCAQRFNPDEIIRMFCTEHRFNQMFIGCMDNLNFYTINMILTLLPTSEQHRLINMITNRYGETVLHRAFHYISEHAKNLRLSDFWNNSDYDAYVRRYGKSMIENIARIFSIPGVDFSIRTEEGFSAVDYYRTDDGGHCLSAYLNRANEIIGRRNNAARVRAAVVKRNGFMIPNVVFDRVIMSYYELPQQLLPNTLGGLRAAIHPVVPVAPAPVVMLAAPAAPAPVAHVPGGAAAPAAPR